MRRHIKLFEDFRIKQEYWVLIYPEESSVEIFDDYNEATMSLERLEQIHRDFSREMFINHEIEDEDFLEEHPGKSDSELEEIAGRLFDVSDYQIGEPPFLIGPIDPAENDPFLIRQMKEMVSGYSEYDQSVVRRFIELGVDPLNVFSSPDHVLKFFNGDIDWMPEGDLKTKLKRMQRGKSAFGM